MTGYLVDTNIPSELTRPVPNDRVVAFLTPAGKAGIYVSVITIGEIAKGITELAEGKRRDELRAWLDGVLRPWFAGRVLPVTESIAERWGVLTAERRKEGRPITMADGLIAATALEHGLTLVTRNARDFHGLGVPVVNPWDSA